MAIINKKGEIINMEKFIINKSKPLNGTVEISGSKNSALPIIASTILATKPVHLKNIPPLADIRVMLQLLKDMGARVNFGKELFIDAGNIINIQPDYDYSKKLRASFLLAGAMLGRFKTVAIPLPGGCTIGTRPVDLHLKGFAALGAECILEHGVVIIEAGRLKGNNIYLDFPSVGATENIMVAAVTAQGTTNIYNCAIEPEIVDLANFLNKMGGNIQGAGTDTITIKGVDKLEGCTHSVISDRIEAGTFMLAAATGGNVVIKNINLEHISPVIHKLKETGVNVIKGEDSLRIISEGVYDNTDIKTMPYPGFPTDMQAQFMSVMTRGKGTGVINETIFENRFMHVSELNRMGADIKIQGKTAVIKGVTGLTGTRVKSTDLRAGAALVISALMAEGQTEIGEIHHIDRGYYSIEKKLRGLGVDIKRVEFDDN